MTLEPEVVMAPAGAADSVCRLQNAKRTDRSSAAIYHLNDILKPKATQPKGKFVNVC